MAATPECPYCGRKTGLRQVHDGGGFTAPEYTCEGCFKATDTGPCFDDLPLAPITMTPREAGEAAFYECEGNNAACLKAAFDAYEAAIKPSGYVSLKQLENMKDGYSGLLHPSPDCDTDTALYIVPTSKSKDAA